LSISDISFLFEIYPNVLAKFGNWWREFLTLRSLRDRRGYLFTHRWQLVCDGLAVP
jgi:hypothetical protein